MIKKNKVIEITYLDAWMIGHQTDEVAEPGIIKAVGFLVKETKEYITIAREKMVDDEWRGQLSIPKVNIITKK